MSELLRTPLFPCYADYPGARCIDFGGWELPVQFEGIQKEHDAVRHQAGLFDVSHMGEFLVEGEGSLPFLQNMLTNDVSALQPGAAQYTLMCYPTGGVVDDLLVYCLSENHYMLVVNASNIRKDWEWLRDHQPEDVQMTDISSTTALIALQGPLAEQILTEAGIAAAAGLSSFTFAAEVELFGAKAILSRTGYTGEDGFEIYAPAEQAPAIWKGLLAAGAPQGLVPAGLGARDTLRFEAKLPLYGQELSATISPLEAGVGFFVKWDKGDFIGRSALEAQKAAGLPRKLVGIEMIDRGIPRSHYPVYGDGVKIGEVTTGTQSPSLKRNLGLALVDSGYAAIGTVVEVEIRGRKLKAEVVKAPFYKKNRKACQRS
ncbi:glycine cleavage system protein T [Paenibacillus yonginensis]|uniref:Aminomethyltransferase n=1 Tax=Paenibacillus yonginensis TaxID=1462996 RepID=A0A1B1N069_9BACL|nr:glycine cleavage system aminomethyltransferase GcvT [Paenibacillus yonginensis]ANS74808.1 glycine cleavage system protein T [Paenibacillus yonginensis]